MRLIKGHIQNFGGLHDVYLDFTKPITEVCERNGYGKTTICAFIKAMLYGMETTKVNDNTLSERAHYMPFNHGLYGGYIFIEYDGKVYQITRRFNEKSKTGDKLSVRVNGEEGHTDELGDDVGYKLFGVDRASFERTAFFSSLFDGDIATPDISRKITGFMGDVVDDSSFERAIKELDSQIKEIKKRGAKGQLEEYKKELFELKAQIAQIEDRREELDSLYAKQDDILKRIEGCRSDISRAQLLLEELKTWQAYDELKEKAERAQNEYNELCAPFEVVPTREQTEQMRALAITVSPSGSEGETLKRIEELEQKSAVIKAKYNNLPTEQEGEDVKQLLERANSLNQTCVFEFSGQVEELCAFFKEGVPTDEQIESALTCVSERDKLITRRDMLEIPTISNELQDNFRLGMPTQEQLESLEREVEEYNSAQSAIVALSAHGGAGKGKYVLASVLGGVLLACGVALAFLVHMAFTALGAVGAVLLLWGVLKSVKDKGAVSAEGYIVKADHLAQSIRTTLSRYGVYESNIAVAYSRFLSNVNEYSDYVSRRTIYYEKLLNFNNDIALINKQLLNLVGAYIPANDISLQSIYALKDKINRYNSLLNQKRAFEQNEQLKKEKLAQTNESIDTLTVNWGVEEGVNGDNIQAIIEDAKNFARYQGSISMLKEGLRTAQAKIEEATAELKALCQSLKIPYITDVKEIDRLEQVRQEIQNLAERLQWLYEQIANVRARYNLVERPRAEDVDDEKAKTVLSSLEEELTSLNKQIGLLEQEIAKIPSLKDRQMELEEAIQILVDKLHFLEVVKSNLEGAQRAIVDRYLSPVRNSYLQYLKDISSIFEGQFSLDGRFKLYFELDGESREEGYLSTGQQAVCALCLRLALIDNMYEKEQPFIVLDDPFVSLDSEAFESVKKVVAKLSENRQIIYFTCHRSRSLK